MFLIARILADIFWNVKFVAIILNGILLLHIVFNLRKYQIKKSQASVLSVLFCLTLSLIYSFCLDVDIDTVIIFVKIFCSYLLFFIGLYANDIMKYSKWTAILSMIIILISIIMLAMGMGYQYWGSVLTFSGLYFFKTDLALSMVISISYILFFYKNKKIKYIFILLALILIFKSNARIHLLTSIGIIIIYLFKEQFFNSSIKKIIFIGIFTVIFSFGCIYVIQQFNLVSGLTVDFDDFGSEANTQGRSLIWENLIDSYNRSSVIKKIFGGGLVEDVKLAKLYGEPNVQYNAHSGYLYSLIAFGLFGIIFFSIFMVHIFKRLFLLLKQSLSSSQKGIILFSISQIFIFFVSSFSGNTIIFQQQTWFFFFWCGILFNKKYFKLN
jgi:hypothetical protein